MGAVESEQYYVVSPCIYKCVSALTREGYFNTSDLYIEDAC